MRIRNAEVYNSYRKCFIRAELTVEDGKFAEIINTGGEAATRIIPGFIDIHSHGAYGVDALGADSGELIKMSGYYAKNGVTSLFVTNGSAKHGTILKMIEQVKKAKPEAKINFEGIHIEGPYINKNRRGAHPPELIKNPDLAELGDIIGATLGCGLKLHISIAPETDGALEFISAALSKGATVSLAHTEADADILNKAIKLGANSFTHLFNAMSPVHHRDAGVAGYALICDNAYAEIICDGVHLCPGIVKLAEKAKGADKIIIVSDSMSAAGMGGGEYNLGKSKGILVENGRAYIKNPDGSETIAGSTANLYEELKNFMSFTGRSLEESLVTVTKNPAECVGIFGRKGSVETGKDADFIVWDKEKNEIREVYVMGERVL